jgi:GMP synthase (glutamine-hydrolysing)
MKLSIAVIDFDHICATNIAKSLGGAELISPYEEVDLASFDGIVLSGTSNFHQSLYAAQYPKTLITELETVRVPILGICFGMQFLIHLYGGKVERGDGEFGWTMVVLDNQNDILADYHRREMVHMEHYYDVVKLPLPHNDYRVIASTHQVSIAGFKHKFLPLYGVIWHPEKMHKRGHILFDNFKRVCHQIKNYC